MDRHNNYVNYAGQGPGAGKIPIGSRGLKRVEMQLQAIGHTKAIIQTLVGKLQQPNSSGKTIQSNYGLKKEFEFRSASSLMNIVMSSQ